MREVTIENETYIVPENINDETNSILLLAEFNQSKIRYHRNMVAVLTKAKRAYIASLKQDILREKAGMGFLEQMPKITIDDIEFNTEDLNESQLEVLASLQFTDTEIKDQINILHELKIVQSSYGHILKETLTLKK